MSAPRNTKDRFGVGAEGRDIASDAAAARRIDEPEGAGRTVQSTGMMGTLSRRTRSYLTERGVRANAVVEEIADEGARMPGADFGPGVPNVVTLQTWLRVVPPNGATPFEVRGRLRYPELRVPEPGTRVSVVYDPDRPSRLVVVGIVQDGAAPLAPAVGNGWEELVPAPPRDRPAWLRSSQEASSVASLAGRRPVRWQDTPPDRPPAPAARAPSPPAAPERIPAPAVRAPSPPAAPERIPAPAARAPSPSAAPERHPVPAPIAPLEPARPRAFRSPLRPPLPQPDPAPRQLPPTPTPQPQRQPAPRPLKPTHDTQASLPPPAPVAPPAAAAAAPRRAARGRGWYLGRGRVALGVAVMVALAAPLGVFLGRQRGASPPARPATTSVASPAFSLDYPAAWQRVAGGHGLSPLGLTGTVQLAGPTGPAHSGLVAGVFKSAGSALPDLGRVATSVPPAQIVRLGGGTEALRFAELRRRGSTQRLNVYVLPTGGGTSVTLACYADVVSLAFLPGCEQTAAAVQVVGAGAIDLSPSPAYAATVDGRLSKLTRERTDRRSQLAKAKSRKRQAAAASALAGAYSTAAARLKTAPAPTLVRTANEGVVAALELGAGAYGDLAQAAVSGNRRSFQRARGAVSEADAALTRGLRTLTVLGYRGA